MGARRIAWACAAAVAVHGAPAQHAHAAGPEDAEWSLEVVKDINAKPEPQSEDHIPSGLAVAGGRLFLHAGSPVTGRERWWSDGTPGSMHMLDEVKPGSEGASFYFNAAPVLGDSLFFAMEGEGVGFELWTLDSATLELRMVSDIAPGPDSATPFALGALGDAMLFSALKPNGKRGLWRTDGTDEGTSLLADIDASSIVRAGDGPGFMFLDIRRGEPGWELWRTDGTVAGTHLVGQYRSGNTEEGLREPRMMGDTLFFAGAQFTWGRELMRSDGTEEGTKMVVTTTSIVSPSPQGLQVVGDRLFFTTTESIDPAALWTSDGTDENTAIVMPFPSGALYQLSPATTAELGGTYYFIARDLSHGYELWKSDGTAEGTAMAVDVAPGSAGGTFGWFRDIGGALFMIADDGGGAGPEPWRTDGTPEGTFLLKDMVPGPTGTYDFGHTEFGGRTFFVANDETGAYNVWATDGTQEGTQRFHSFNEGTAACDPSAAADLGGTLLFIANGGMGTEADRELWRSDGTAEGTMMLKDVYDGVDWRGAQAAVPFGDVALFAARAGAGGTRLWRTDGTPEGTQPVFDPECCAASAPGVVSDLASMGDYLLFRASIAGQGYELWRTDGTPEGTRMVVPDGIVPGSGNSLPGPFAKIGDTALFAATAPGIGRELWRTDGTEAGTQLVKDIAEGTGSSNPAAIVAAGTGWFLRASHPDSGGELWTSDGTGAGTTMVKDILPGTGSGLSTAPRMVPVGENLFFLANDGVHANALWSSDGTDAGTQMLKDLTSLSIGAMVPLDSELLFMVEGDDWGLWKSDGTPEGTTPVKLAVAGEFEPVVFTLPPASAGPGGSAPVPVGIAAGGAMFFAARDAERRMGVWKTDGTEAGTVRVSSMFSGGRGDVLDFALAGDLLYVVANDSDGVPPDHGKELFALGVTAAADHAPTVPVLTGPAKTGPGTFIVQADFGEEVRTLHGNEIAATNATVSGLSHGGNGLFAFHVTPLGEDTVTVQIPAGVVRDAGAAANEASNVLEVVVDPDDAGERWIVE